MNLRIFDIVIILCLSFVFASPAHPNSIAAPVAFESNQSQEHIAQDAENHLRINVNIGVSIPNSLEECVIDDDITMVDGRDLATEAGKKMAEIFHASDSMELISELKQASGGDIIELAAGNYSDVTLSNLNFNDTVIIRSASNDHRADFNTLLISGSSNIEFNSVDFDFKPGQETVSWDSAIRIVGSNEITVRNSSITGGPAVNGVPPETEAGGLDKTGNVLGLPAGRGITVSGSSNVTIEQNEISQLENGVVADGTDGLKIINNAIHDLRSSPLRGGNVSNLFVDGNHFYNFFPWKFGGAGDHGDQVHFWTRANQDGPNVNYTITNNFFEQGAGTAMLGVYLDDNGQGIGYENVNISNNIIYNGNLQGIRLEHVISGVIEFNTMLSNSSDAADGPTIVLRDGSEDLQINNNIASNPISTDRITNIESNNNLIVQGSDPNAPNYVGNLFVNPLAGGAANLADLQALPHSIVEQMGVGAASTIYGSLPSQMTGFISDDAGSGLDLLRHTFTVSDIAGPAGELDLAGATVNWDFGDNTPGSNSSSHTYTHAGRFNVTASIALAEGGTINLEKTVEVQTPIALFSDFDNGARDLSDISNAVTIGQKVSFEKHGDGEALRLNGDIVTYSRSPDFFNNSEYSVLVDFKKDSGHEAGGGRLVNFSGSFVVFVEDDNLSVQLTTDKGTIWLKAQDVGVADDNWHSLALTFSGVDGTAKLYLDGHDVASADGLAGATQIGLASQPIYLGNPWGAEFSGLIDNFAFIKGALTQDALAAGNSSIENIAAHDSLSSGSNSQVAAPPVNSDDTTPVPPSAVPNIINGTDGDDHINGTNGADDIHSDAGKDQVYAASGDDIVHLGDQDWGLADGGLGNDTLYGGPANDTLVGGDGNDTLYGGGGMDHLSGGNGDDTLIGGTSRDWLYGEAGNDTLVASNSEYNTLDGGEGNDSLVGGTQRDYLFGGVGDDVLVGGGGKDDLTGGAGADKFVFGPDSGPDHLLDFNPHEDTIVLQGLNFQSVEQVLQGAFDDKGTLIVPLDGPDVPFSWSSSDYVSLVGIHIEDLTNANISLVA
jgi:Ca2+-binding RTX toxin-like protein